jgi:uncharacterized protein (TIGR02266 family)
MVIKKPLRRLSPAKRTSGEQLVAWRRLIEAETPLPPFVDADVAARAALLAVDLLNEPAHRERLAALEQAGSFDLATLESTKAVARAMLEQSETPAAVTRIDIRGIHVGPIEGVSEIRSRMMGVVERTLDDFEGPHIWLETMRLASGESDWCSDLRALAYLYDSHLDLLSDDAEFDARDITRARTLADRLSSRARATTAENAELRALCFARLAREYDDLVRAARFLRVAELPSLGAIARAQRKRAHAAPRTRSIPAPAPPPIPQVAPPPLPVPDEPVDTGWDAPSVDSIFAMEDHQSLETILSVPAPPPPVDAPVLEVLSEVEEVTDELLELEEKVEAAPEPPPQERADDRRLVELEVAFGTESNFYLGFTENISSGGLFVATYRVLPIGEKVSLSLSLPGDEQLTLDGEVRWVRHPQPDYEIWPGMGIQFDRLTPEQEQLIQEFVSLRQPLFFEPE